MITYKCDKCGKELDTIKMSTMQVTETTNLERYELCPECYKKFKEWIAEDGIMKKFAASSASVVTDDTPIGKTILALSTRAYNALARNNIRTIGTLKKFSKDDLIKMHHISWSTADQIDIAMRHMGHELAKESAERDCANCVHRKATGCESWECKFERR